MEEKHVVLPGVVEHVDFLIWFIAYSITVAILQAIHD
jgi:hypothetical protein